MSLYSKAFLAGISRIFTLPRLSIPLIVTLGLTLGAVLSVLAVATPVLFKPLQGIKDEQQIKSIDFRMQIGATIRSSYWTMRRLADINGYFGSLGEWAGVKASSRTAAISDISYPITRYQASNTILSVLGSQLISGEDVTTNHLNNVVWISQSLSKTAYPKASSAIGKSLNFDGKNYVIKGVIEDVYGVPSHQPISPNQVWFIYDLAQLFGKLEDGSKPLSIEHLLLKTTVPDSRLPTLEQLTAWFYQYVAVHSTEPQDMHALHEKMIKHTSITTLRSSVIGRQAHLIIALFAAVCGLLLMASLNLLNLFIAYYQTRTREFALQLGLGSPVGRLRRLLLLENLPSFVLAAMLGLLVAGWILRILPTISQSKIPLIHSVHIDGLIWLCALVIIFLLSLLFSVVGLLDIDKTSLANNLNSSGKGSGSQSNQLLSRILMVFQLSLASALLTASMMLAIQSYQAVYRDLGYELGNSYQVTLDYADPKWKQSLEKYDAYQTSEIKHLLSGLSQTIETTIANSEVILAAPGPLADSFMVYSLNNKDHPEQPMIYQHRYMAPGLFNAFAIPMLAGANVTQQQIDNSERRVVIDSAMADLLYPDKSYPQIIGEPIWTGSKPSIITGIVAITHTNAGAVGTLQLPSIYQWKITASNQITLTVKLPAGESLTTGMLSQVIKDKYPKLKQLEVKSYQAIWLHQTLEQRISLWLILAVTTLTLFLAIIGIAGMTRMTTNHRQYELAIRMATGAKQSALVGFIVKDALWMLLAGLGCGFILSVFGYTQLKGQLTMLPDFDWPTMAVLNSVLIVVVLLAVMIPAWRVIRDEPMRVLRQE